MVCLVVEVKSGGYLLNPNSAALLPGNWPCKTLVFQSRDDTNREKSGRPDMPKVILVVRVGGETLRSSLPFEEAVAEGALWRKELGAIVRLVRPREDRIRRIREAETERKRERARLREHRAAVADGVA